MFGEDPTPQLARKDGCGVDSSWGRGVTAHPLEKFLTASNVFAFLFIKCILASGKGGWEKCITPVLPPTEGKPANTAWK